MKKSFVKKKNSIHFVVDATTYQQWLNLCEHLKGNTRTAVFKTIVHKLNTSLNESLKINNYEIS